jgi:colanic acid/amylovoran biosynthesis glycosyltransferase
MAASGPAGAHTVPLTRDEAPDTGSAVDRPQGKVAYLVSRFPKITETFVLYEMLAVEQAGLQIELYPLQRERTTLMHAEAEPFVERAHFQPLLSWPIVRAQVEFLRRKPRAYLAALWTLVRANWGSLRYLGGALAFFPKTVYFAQSMAAQGVTHLHAHFASHPAAAAWLIHRLVGIPYSFTAHGSDLHRDRHMLREKVAEAAFVVPISHYNREIIVETCGEQSRDKVIVIRCGVDPAVFQPHTAPTRFEQGLGRFTILCIGTLHEVKGQTYLIEACRRLREQSIAFDCHFLGDGPDQTMLEAQVKAAGLVDVVHFHGRVTRDDVARLLQQADVVATPSVPSRDGRREGLPVVLMEAMCSGVAVVASRLSGIPELVEDEQCGLLCPPGDVEALAAALQRLYHDGALRQRLGQAGRKKVLAEFDLYQNAAALAHHMQSHMRSHMRSLRRMEKR